MKTFIVYGFSSDNVWKTVEIKTIPEMVEQRAKEKGMREVTFFEELKR